MSVEGGQTLSHYRLINKIGEGGMGVVWKAEDTVLGRTVAIKVLPADVSRDESRRQMFLEEARLASSVSAAHIAQVYEFGREGDLDFIVMEYVEGQPLGKLLHGRPLPPHKVAEFGYQIANALSKAHRTKLLHRDLKPANILVTPDGEVKVLDFGLATLFERTDTVHPSQATTLMGQERSESAGLAGTLPYMSPEQARMEQLDARSDIFSLGTILYEMTTGQLPFTGPTNAEVLQAVQRARPQPVHDLLPQVPLELNRIIQKAMAPRRNERYQDVQDLAVDLKRLGKDLESGSSPSYESLQGAADRSARRVPRWTTLTLLGLVVVVVLALAMFWPGRDREAPQTASATIPDAQTEIASIAVLPFADMSPAKDQEYFTDGLSEELLNVLARIRGLRVAARTSSFSFKGKNVTIADIGRELNVVTVLEGSVRKAGNQVRITAQLVNVADGFHLWSETYDRDLSDIFAVQDEIARSVARELQVTLMAGGAGALFSSPEVGTAAYTAYLRGQHLLVRELESDLWKAAGYFEEALAIAPNYALAWTGLARARMALATRGYISVDEGFAEAQKAVDRALELDDNLAETYLSLAGLKAYHEYDRTGAETAIQRALELEPGNAQVQRWAASLAAAEGRFDEAIVISRRAVQLDPLNVQTLSHHGIFALRSGLPDEAAAALRQAVELQSDFPAVHSRLCLVYLEQGRAEEALAEAEIEAHPLYRLYGLALAYHALGKQEAADSALAEFIEAYGDVAAFQVADVHAFRDESDRAFEWLERAHAQRDSGLAWLRVSPNMRNLYDDPRWEPFLAKMRLADRP